MGIYLLFHNEPDKFHHEMFLSWTLSCRSGSCLKTASLRKTEKNNKKKNPLRSGQKIPWIVFLWCVSPQSELGKCCRNCLCMARLQGCAVPACSGSGHCRALSSTEKVHEIKNQTWKMWQMWQQQLQKRASIYLQSSSQNKAAARLEEVKTHPD